MSAVDTAWLRMDRPHNLMMISGVLMFREKLSLARIAERGRPAPGEAWVAALASLSALPDEELLVLADEALGDLRQKLPHEITEGPDALALGDRATLRRLLEEAQEAIVARAEGELEA